MSEEALLRFHPGQFVENVGGEDMWIGLSRDATFPSVRVKGIQGDGRGIATGAGEDFASVVQGFAEGISEISGQAVERSELQFVLEAMIDGPCPVVASADQGEVAVSSTEGSVRSG